MLLVAFSRSSPLHCCRIHPTTVIRRSHLARTMTTRATRPSPSEPRPSASLIIVNPQNEVLLVQRNPKAGTFAGAHVCLYLVLADVALLRSLLSLQVFPGGNYDSKQDDSLAMTAIRETFEETGLLVTSTSRDSSLPDDAELDVAREAIHSQKQLFRDFLAKHHLTLDTDALLPFTQWITPPTQARRFHTQFYVTFLDAAPSTGFTSGQKQDRLPTPDGGQEVIAARFIHPSLAISDFQARKLPIFPPQYYLLHTLAEFLQGSSNTRDQRAQVERLALGGFGKMVIQPRALAGKDDVGRTVLIYAGDEASGGPTGRMHRAHVNFGKGGFPVEIEVKRNFDIFTEIEPHVGKKDAKL
ncbi:hypothetical protein BXZ70DRAFT_234370 [Cristinia sonorae]|uniref:Nudix hydrolase domain-containing protein n=1 Tax=Cristinia sonorae TaxID=1940300 RepID=A0A8K0XNU6_9AGAR|nr:hypothetical protein BXZ70DRAFT_234370 [Cristinia sonorae]